MTHKGNSSQMDNGIGLRQSDSLGQCAAVC